MQKRHRSILNDPSHSRCDRHSSIFTTRGLIERQCIRIDVGIVTVSKHYILSTGSMQATTQRSTIVYGFMNVTSNTTTPSTVYTYQFTTTSCTIQDEPSGWAVSGANVTFWRNGT